MCPAWIVNISKHLRTVHEVANEQQRGLLAQLGRHRVRLANLVCPLCGKLMKYPERHLESGHRGMSESSRSDPVRSLERSVTAGKLRILRDSEPAIPLVPDFSQHEAPPDVQLPQVAASPTTAAEEMTLM
ncbi:hypothetical protein DPX16_2677 [Anabarilius grahami]|uniref:Uncharacterized protein n=1 Tax=Anabarilius grahami TaxID=495550 RepID=A0A3N0YPG9_ANAGA|nr:hypothetical protein DPX16_2677 [Anabarilius grahami]